MQNEPLFNGFFQKKEPPNNQQTKQEESRYKQLLTIAITVGVLLYPFFFMGVIPLLIARSIDKKDRADHVQDLDYQSFLKRTNNYFMLISFALALVNIALFILVIPRGYFSCYLLFPLNWFTNALTFSWQTVLALVVGGLGMGAIQITYAGFLAKRKVVSKEAEQQKILNSKAYKKRKEDKFKQSQNFTKEYEGKYDLAIQMTDLSLKDERLEALAKVLLLGVDEYGFAYFMDFDELNQHALIPATTGSGKTTLIQVFIEHAAKFGIPVILIDGKGAEETLDSMKGIAAKYDKKVYAFSDTKDMRYNPVKHGNDISVRDKLASLAETESVYYSMASKALLQVTVQLLDEFNDVKGIERSLPCMQTYLLPRNVLDLFAGRLLPNVPKLFEQEIVVNSAPKQEKNKVKTSEESSDEAIKDLGKKRKNEGDNAKQETKTIVLDPKTMPLDDYYFLLKTHFDQMSDKEQKLFTRLFVRYEHKETPFYLYATSEALQTNINMLLDSELGKLFEEKDEKKCNKDDSLDDELDIQTIVDNNAIAYVSLNGLIYDEFITTLAQLLIGDINYYLSEVYKGDNKKEGKEENKEEGKKENKDKKKKFLAIFDEPASYLNKSFIDLVNKGRGAGLHAIFSPQTMADIDALGDNLKQQLVGNVNTFFIGKTNEKDEVSYWAETFGTYSDIDVTEMTEQEAGYSDAGKTDWTGGRGTKRNVDRFKFNPNRIRDLRQGEFVVYRTAKEVHEAPRAVYIRKPSEKKIEKEKEKGEIV